MQRNEADGRQVLERMRERASCRNFEDREIPNELLKDILRTGLTAAAGGNLQPYSIIVVKDPAQKAKLAELNGNQGFIAQASVDLIFLLDWYKFSVFASQEKAPFTCHKSFMHYCISLEDMMCAAQTIETAAHLCGLASCYVGTVNYCGDELKEMLDLPEYTYPLLMLSVGYPKNELTKLPKLPYDAMVFEGKYPEMSEARIEAAFRAKYGDRAMELPSNPEARRKMLCDLKEALMTTYDSDETEAILAEAERTNKISETQRRFGLHYHAARMIDTGRYVMETMRKNGFNFFA